MSDLLLDPQIQFWVIVPIMIITIMVALGRTYVMQMMQSPKAADKEKLLQGSLKLRGAFLRENGNAIPKSAFYSRKAFLNGKDGGKDGEGAFAAIVEQYKDKAPENPLQDPNAMQNMMNGQLVNMVPMIVVGQVIAAVFAGFVVIRVPFPLTPAFKPMLQQGIGLEALSVSWVSSMSFYLICVFGLRSVVGLLLGSDAAPDPQMAMMQQQMGGGQQQGAVDLKKVFGAEIEALEIVQHDWNLNPRAARGDTMPGLAAVEAELLQKWGAL